MEMRKLNRDPYGMLPRYFSRLLKKAEDWRVVLAIACWAKPSGIACVSVRQIARECNLDPANVHRAMLITNNVRDFSIIDDLVKTQTP